eukprot:scaffold8421_cov114-Isochrysis_galbana.AAC.4
MFEQIQCRSVFILVERPRAHMFYITKSTSFAIERAPADARAALLSPLSRPSTSAYSVQPALAAAAHTHLRRHGDLANKPRDAHLNCSLAAEVGPAAWACAARSTRRAGAGQCRRTPRRPAAQKHKARQRQCDDASHPLAHCGLRMRVAAREAHALRAPRAAAGGSVSAPPLCRRRPRLLSAWRQRQLPVPVLVACRCSVAHWSSLEPLNRTKKYTSRATRNCISASAPKAGRGSSPSASSLVIGQEGLLRNP